MHSDSHLLLLGLHNLSQIWLDDICEEITFKVLQVYLTVKVNHFNSFLVWEDAQEVLSLVSLFYKFTPKILFKIKNTSFEALNFLCSFEASFSIDSLFKLVNLLNCQKWKSNTRESLQGFYEILNILIIWLSLINIKHE